MFYYKISIYIINIYGVVANGLLYYLSQTINDCKSNIALVKFKSSTILVSTVCALASVKFNDTISSIISAIE